MKRFVIALFLLVLSVSISILGFFLLNNNVSKLSSALENCSDSESADAVYSLWDDKKFIFHTFLKSDTVEEIENSFFEMKIASESNDFEKLSLICKQLKFRLYELTMSEMPFLSNIL